MQPTSGHVTSAPELKHSQFDSLGIHIFSVCLSLLYGALHRSDSASFDLTSTFLRHVHLIHIKGFSSDGQATAALVGGERYPKPRVTLSISVRIPINNIKRLSTRAILNPKRPASASSMELCITATLHRSTSHRRFSGTCT